ncbi:META domain-containing protein [Roseibium aggregatum]|uniref:META domain-containing protein n=1 Tax=Roseibium aggregatum TaxID=187304 RepID=A0A926S6R7_9HYPH|nr:META domain-containing protein [Roseibium aggregatum]MBD1548828.1 META domain-containing protein [Roseibium aggregatum]
MRIVRERWKAVCGGIALCAALVSGQADRAAGQDVPAGLVAVWRVEAISGEPVDPGIGASLEFEGSGTVDGSGGCNSLFGPYSNEDGFRIGPLAVTRKACPPNVLTQEQALLKAISAVRDFRLDSDNQLLVLMNGTGDEVVRLSAGK